VYETYEDWSHYAKVYTRSALIFANGMLSQQRI